MPQVHHDEASLRRYLELPEGLGEVVWAVAPLGVPGLGPTDLRLVIWFPSVPEARRHALLTESRAAVFPGDPLVRSVLPEGGSGTAYAATAFENIFWKGGAAWALGEGIFVELYSQ